MTVFPLLLPGFLLMTGQAGSAESPRIAVIDVPAVSESYDKTADLEAKFESVRQQLNRQRDELRDKVELTRRSLQEELKPGTDEYRARRKQLALLEAELQYFMESEGKSVEAELADSLVQIFDDIKGMIRVVAEEKGIDVVMSADRMPEDPAESPTQVRQQIILQKVLYWSPQVDLTGEVIARLNAKYKAQREEAPKE